MTNRESILIVDDDLDVTSVLREFPKQEGYAVTAGRTGAAELRLIQVVQSRRAAERTRAIPVLVLSNSSRGGDVRDLTKLGIEGSQVEVDLWWQELGDRVVAILNGKARG